MQAKFPHALKVRTLVKKKDAKDMSDLIDLNIFFGILQKYIYKYLCQILLRIRTVFRVICSSSLP